MRQAPRSTHLEFTSAHLVAPLRSGRVPVKAALKEGEWKVLSRQDQKSLPKGTGLCLTQKPKILCA